MNASFLIALIAGILSALTFVATQFGMTTTQRVSHVASLEAKIAKLEERIGQLEDENVRLMRKLMRAEQ